MPKEVHHLHVRPINGRRLRSAIPTRIPIMQILNFVILNSVVSFFLATKAAMTPPKIAQSTPPIAIITWGFSVDSNASIGETINGNPTVIMSKKDQS